MKKLLFTLCCLATLAYADQTSNDLHDYFMANYYQFGGKMKKSYELYKELLSQTAPVYAYKGYVHLLFDTSNYAHIDQLIVKLDSLFENDPAVQLIFAQVHDKLRKTNLADDRLIRLTDRFKTHQEIIFAAANSYLRRKEPENAQKVIETLLNNCPRRGNHFIFYFMLSQIHLQLNNKHEALKSVQKSIDMHPRFDKGWLLYSLLCEQENQISDAIKGYTTFLHITGGNVEIERHLLQLVFKQKLKQHKGKTELMVDKKCLEGALQLFEQKKYDKALEGVESCIKKEAWGSSAPLHHIYGHLLKADRKTWQHYNAHTIRQEMLTKIA